MDQRHIYLLEFAFNGTAYAGWQRQPGGVVTVQQTFEEVLRNLFHNDSLVLSGCGRTDTGVHAMGMTASFKTPCTIDEKDVMSELGRRLPHDMRVISIRKMPSGFSNVSAVKGKAYVYAVNTGYENLFLRDACWSWEHAPHMDDAIKAVSMFAGTRDFRSFTGRLDDPSTVRTLFRAESAEFGPVVCFYFSGTGFLHKMVRRMTGFLHRIALGELTPDDLRKALEEPAPPVCGEVAPPHGLYLKKVFYSPDDWKKDTLDVPPFCF